MDMPKILQVFKWEGSQQNVVMRDFVRSIEYKTANSQKKQNDVLHASKSYVSRQTNPLLHDRHRPSNNSLAFRSLVHVTITAVIPTSPA